MPLVLLLQLACRPEAANSAAAPYEPVPYSPELGGTSDMPVFDAEAMAVAISTALDAGRGITGAPVFAAYNEVMSSAEDGCPNYYATDGNVYWYDRCTTSSGSTFSGYSFYYNYTDYAPGDGNIYNGQQLYGVAQMWDAEGHELNLGGSAADVKLTAVDGSYTYWYSVAQGSFSWDGTGTEGSWVTPGMAPDLVLNAIEYPTYDGHMFYMNGGVSGIAGDYASVVFDALTLYDAGIGGACPEEPGGTISVRDANGYWYDLFLDGQLATEDEVSVAACDGCADAWYQGQNLGPVCVDYSALTSWRGAPW